MGCAVHSPVAEHSRGATRRALFDVDGEMIRRGALPVHLGALATPSGGAGLTPSNELFCSTIRMPGSIFRPHAHRAIDIDGRVGGYSVVRAHHSDVGGMTAGKHGRGGAGAVSGRAVIPRCGSTPISSGYSWKCRRQMRRGDLPAASAPPWTWREGCGLERAVRLGGAARGGGELARLTERRRRLCFEMSVNARNGLSGG